MRKGLLFALLGIVLAGCVTVATNTLSLDDVATFRLAGVDVDFAPDTQIWWGDGERAFAASKGQPATESDNLAKTSEAQAYLRNTIAAKIKTAMERNLSSGMAGPRPVRVRVTVKAVVLASTIQRVLVGGNHTMTADVTVVDAKTGAALLPYAAQSTVTGAGQGIGGVLIDAALLGDPMDRVVGNYSSVYGNWLLRRNPTVDFAAGSG